MRHEPGRSQGARHGAEFRGAVRPLTPEMLAPYGIEIILPEREASPFPQDAGGVGEQENIPQSA